MRWDLDKFRQWIRDNITLPGADGRPVKFVLNRAQELLLETAQARGESGWLTTAKARQVGGTTFWLLLIAFLSIKYPGIQTLIVTPNEIPTGDEVIAKWRALLDAIERAPHSGWPGKMRHDSKGETVWANGSRVAWHHIGGTDTVADAVGRGGTYAFCLLTELAFPYDPALAWRTIDAVAPALERAGAPVVVDSTPGESPGAGDCYRQLLDDAVTRGIGDYVLLPWWTYDGYRIDPAPPLGKISKGERRLIARHGLDAGQIAWRRRKITPRSGETPQSARRRFTRAYLERIEDALRQDHGSEIWPADYIEALTGRDFLPPIPLAGVLERFGPDDLAHRPDNSPRGYVRARALPTPGRQYFAGVDPADGLPGGDWSTLWIIDDRSEIVLTARLKIPTLEAAAIIQRLATVYRAPLRVEKNKGALLVRYLREPASPEVATDGALAVLRNPCATRVTTFQVTVLTRPEVLGAALELLGDPDIVPDRETAEELLALKRVKGRLEARSGQHDDLIFAAGFAVLERRLSLTTPRPAGRSRRHVVQSRATRYDYLIDGTDHGGYPLREGHRRRRDARRDPTGDDRPAARPRQEGHPTSAGKGRPVAPRRRTRRP